MDELVNAVGMIGVFKSSLPVEARGWVNVLGLYVQVRQWFGGQSAEIMYSRYKAGGKYRCYLDFRHDLDFRDDGVEDIRVLRFDEATWNRRFAHLVKPTYQIGEFLKGPHVGKPESMEAKIAVVRKAIAEFRRTGEWIDLPKTAKEAQQLLPEARPTQHGTG